MSPADLPNMRYAPPASSAATLSVVVPLYNEAFNVEPLHRTLHEALADYQGDYEIILVNDGSTDATASVLDLLADTDPQLCVIHLRRNFGQTAALSAGMDASVGELIVTLDGDLQNDPHDIPAMVAQLEADVDLVHGYRPQRQDTLWTRKLPSRIANWLIRRATGVPVRDLGCALKVIRREVACELSLYGEMHRFIAVLAHAQGARIREVATHHQPRRHGTTSYGLTRTISVLLDLLTVRYLTHYAHAPMRWFGGLGLAALGLSAAAATGTVVLKQTAGFDVTGNPLLYVALFCAMFAVQFFSLGILGEMGTRTHFESQGRRPYAIRRIHRSQSRPRAA